jgi:putative tryptophan/tyrosine transport system substrate-binding protein
MVPRQRNAADEILLALEADPALIEHYDPIDIEATPLAAIQARLIELGLPPTVPAKLQRVLLDPAPSPAADVLRALADDLDCLKPQDVEVRPLADVAACLQQSGINYRAGIAAIVDFMGERSESANIDKNQTKVRSIKWLPLQHRKSLFLVTIGSAATATAAAAAIGFFVTTAARQDKFIADQRYEIQELSAQVQLLKARLEPRTEADNLISLTMRAPPSDPLGGRTWPQQRDGDNAPAVSARPQAPPSHGFGDGVTARDDTRPSANVAAALVGPTPEVQVGAGVRPVATRAPQPGLPLVAFITAKSEHTSLPAVDAFRKGLRETGYVEDRNVTLEYHWLDGQFDRLPALMADLVRRRVAVITTLNNTLIATTAKGATATTPIVFSVGADPVKNGLVASFAQPGGNATGVNYFALEVSAKRLALLHALAPKATRVAILVNPANGPSANVTLRSVEDAARSLGLQTKTLNASTSREIDAAFASLADERADVVLFVSADGFFQSRSEQLVALAARDKIPTAYPDRATVQAGGLMAYGTDVVDMYRQVGVYTGNILRGAKPADLPVQQSTKFEFVINRKTAEALGLGIPVVLRVSADLID